MRVQYQNNPNVGGLRQGLVPGGQPVNSIPYRAPPPGQYPFAQVPPQTQPFQPYNMQQNMIPQPIIPYQMGPPLLP